MIWPYKEPRETNGQINKLTRSNTKLPVNNLPRLETRKEKQIRLNKSFCYNQFIVSETPTIPTMNWLNIGRPFVSL